MPLAASDNLDALIFRLLDEPYTPEWWQTNNDLIRIGVLAVPDLVRVIEDGTPDAAAAAERILGDIGPRAQSAAPVLLARLDAADVRIRSEAAHALARINPKLKFAVSQIIERLVVEDSMATLPRSSTYPC